MDFEKELFYKFDLEDENFKSNLYKKKVKIKY